MKKLAFLILFSSFELLSAQCNYSVDEYDKFTKESTKMMPPELVGVNTDSNVVGLSVGLVSGDYILCASWSHPKFTCVGPNSSISVIFSDGYVAKLEYYFELQCEDRPLFICLFNNHVTRFRTKTITDLRMEASPGNYIDFTITIPDFAIKAMKCL